MPSQESSVGTDCLSCACLGVSATLTPKTAPLTGAEPREFEEVQLAVLQELGAPIKELFAEFEPQARAAASLAQVQAWTPDCSSMCN